MSVNADDVKTQLEERLSSSPAPLRSFRVTVESGPDVGTSIDLKGNEPAETIVGQSPVCALRLTDPMVSRRHLALEVVRDKLRVRDLQSTNGTFVGSLRIMEALASTGDAVTIGRTTLRLAVAGPAEASLPAMDHFGGVLGFSREMRRLFPLLKRLAASTVPVLVEGETGTGKEAVSQAIHESSPRASKPFVVFDCTAVASNLIESELFGHEKGAFTGAAGTRRGVFEQAHGGTLLIDELGDLPGDLQPKLLRAIETGQVRRVGAEKWIPCDVRIIAATRRDLERLVQQGSFRDDLFHRLAVGRVALPPLRERKGDVPLLVEHFCQQNGASPTAIPRELVDDWCARAWPGNLRELRNAVSRYLALGELAREPAAPQRSAEPADGNAGQAFFAVLEALLPYDEAQQKTLELFRRAYIERIMLASGGNVQRGAELAGVALRYFQLLRARYRDNGRP